MAKSSTPEYIAWQNAKARCFNTNHPFYEHYGKRSITMSDEFANSFEAFREHVGPRPTAKHSLDRIDNDKGYVRDNLRWANHSQQQRNRRKPRKTWLTVRGVTKPISDWAAETGVPYMTIRDRLSWGYSPEDAIKVTNYRFSRNKVQTQK